MCTYSLPQSSYLFLPQSPYLFLPQYLSLSLLQSPFLSLTKSPSVSLPRPLLFLLCLLLASLNPGVPNAIQGSPHTQAQTQPKLTYFDGPWSSWGGTSSIISLLPMDQFVLPPLPQSSWPSPIDKATCGIKLFCVLMSKCLFEPALNWSVFVLQPLVIKTPFLVYVCLSRLCCLPLVWYCSPPPCLQFLFT